jgi:hypothetical protein
MKNGIRFLIKNSNKEGENERIKHLSDWLAQ